MEKRTVQSFPDGNMGVKQSRVASIVCPIREKTDLTTLCEVEHHQTRKFIRSTFAYIDEEDIAWFGQNTDKRKYDLTLEDLKRDLQQIPDDKVYPLKPSFISVMSGADRQNIFIKRPSLICADNEEELKLVPRILLGEAEILEFLKQHHHPNLVRYYGCIVSRDRITGIVLERYKVILQYRYEDVLHDLDITACMEGIRAGVRHLHSLGLAHNDLNPTNIALDGDDNPIILDFGSCKRFSETLLSAGTPGWIDEDYSISAQCHDESAMDKIEAWLIKERKNRGLRNS